LHSDRADGASDDGNPISFTVLKVRTKFMLVATGKILNIYEDIPIALIDGVNNGRNVGLQTPIYGNNIGSQNMLLLPKFWDVGVQLYNQANRNESA
jgi:hypothetical protein